MKGIALAALALAASPAAALSFDQALTVTSYSIPVPGNTYYYNDDSYDGVYDSGRYVGGKGDLTDGYVLTGEHWYESQAALNAVVGWDSINPQLTFNFAGGTHFNSATLYFDDDNGHAGVTMPDAVIATINGVTYTATLFANDGPDARATFFFGGVTGDHIDFDVQRGGQWTMMSEATFRGTAAPVPEPGEWAMMLGGLAIAGGVAKRRRAARS